MALLSLILQHGFQDDHVVVQLDGNTVFDRRAVRTRMQVDSADSFDVQLSGSRHDLVVRLPERGLSKSLQIDARSDVSVIVDVGQDGLVFRTERGTIGYA